MKFLYLISSLLLVGCHISTDKEVYQSSRDNILNVKNLIKEIDLGDIYLNVWARTVSTDSFLIIGDRESLEHPINIFDKKTFKHIASFGAVGQGPNEITEMSDINFDAKSRNLYVNDLGKRCVLSFQIDSVIKDANYAPIEKYKLSSEHLPFDNHFLNDSLSYSVFMLPDEKDGYNYNDMTGIINYSSGETNIKYYNREEFHRKQYFLAVSFTDSLYAECNSLFDIISIFDLNGNLLRTIYGPQWGTDYLACFNRSIYTKDYLFCHYDGNLYEEFVKSSKCMIFTKMGDYIATLETGYRITCISYDSAADRIVFTFDDEIQFGYLDLESIKPLLK